MTRGCSDPTTLTTMILSNGRADAQLGEVAMPEQLAVLGEILGRPEFRVGEGRSPLDLLFDPIRTLLWAVAREVLRWLGRLPQGSDEAPTYFGALIALAVVVVAGVVLARVARGAMADEAELTSSASSGPLGADNELAQARSLAEAGDLRGALHHHYLGALRRLDERELLPFDRSLTNRELLPRAGANQALAESLAPLVAAFDRLWYGQASCSHEEYAQFAALADRVWRAAG